VKRWWVILALLLSLGLNLGLLATMAGAWWASRHPAQHASVTAPEVDGPGVDGPGLDVDVPAADVPAAGGEGVGAPPQGGLGPPAFGPPEGGGPPAGPLTGPPLDRLADHLGLEGERREKFVALQRNLFETLLEAHNRRAYLTAEMRRELIAAQPDRQHVEELIDELGKLHVEIERATASTILDSRGLLDPRQQRLYLQVLERLRNGGGRRRGGAAERPGPPPWRRGSRFEPPGGGEPPPERP